MLELAFASSSLIVAKVYLTRTRMELANIAFWIYLFSVLSSICLIYPIHCLVECRKADTVFLDMRHGRAIVNVFGILIWITGCEIVTFLLLLYINMNMPPSYTAAFCAL